MLAGLLTSSLAAQRLGYSSFLGGGSVDAANAIAVDRDGNVYIAGQTDSGDFPVTAGALQVKNGGTPTTLFRIGATGSTDVFVAKIAAGGRRVVWSTYLGGSGDDAARSIAVDEQGNVYVAGVTRSENFPVTAAAFQRTATFRLSQESRGFIAKLNPAGTALLYSTYLGGSGANQIESLALGADGSAYVTGTTTSPDFPVTPGAWQTSYPPSRSPFFDAAQGFVAKVHPLGGSLVYSTFLTGGNGSQPTSIAVDEEGSAVVAGSTQSPNFPITPGAFQDTPGPVPQAFLTKVHPAGVALIWSTFLGQDYVAAKGVAVSPVGEIYVAGQMGPPERLRGFVSRLTRDGGLVYSRALGGAPGLEPRAVAVDAEENVVVAGFASAPDLAVTVDSISGSFENAPCYQEVRTPFQNSTITFNCGDAFVTKLDGGGTLVFASYFGGNESDVPRSVAVDGGGGFYVTGSTRSTNLPVTEGAIQPLLNRATCGYSNSPTAFSANYCGDAFIARFDFGDAGTPSIDVLNGASRLPGAIAAGQAVIIRHPTITEDVRTVLFNEIATPVLKASAGEVLVTVPANIVGTRSNVRIEVGARSADVGLAAPGIFTLDGSGRGEAALLNADGSVNSEENRAAPGSVVAIYTTGVGSTATVYVGGKPVEVLFAGPAPGVASGVQQINFRAPSGAGRASLFVTASDQYLTSQAGVFMYVGR